MTPGGGETGIQDIPGKVRDGMRQGHVGPESPNLAFPHISVTVTPTLLPKH